MNWKAFRVARDLARQYGASPEKFEQTARKNDLLSEGLAFCHQCWEAKNPASMSRREKHTCCSCESDRNAEWNRRAQQRTIKAGAARSGQSWEGWEIQYLEEHIKTQTMEQMAGVLERTRDAVNTKCCDLGLFENRRKPKEIPPIEKYLDCRKLPAEQPVRIEHQEEKGRIVAFCHANTTDEEVYQAFVTARLSEEQFALWLEKREKC